MPFTFAHPAAILPIHRWFPRVTVPPALVLGSLVPDFAYWLPVGFSRASSHSIAGLFLFCLPLGLALYLLHHGVVKAALVALLPPAIGERVPVAHRRVPAFSNQSAVVVAVSILLGAFTHIAWDSFTHADAPGVRAFPVLSQVVFIWAGWPVRVHRLLQHASTMIGFGALLLWVVRWVRRTPRVPLPAPGTQRERVVAWGAIALVAFATGLLASRGRWLSAHDVYDLHAALFVLVTRGIGGMGLGLLGFAALRSLPRRPRPLT